VLESGVMTIFAAEIVAVVMTALLVETGTFKEEVKELPLFIVVAAEGSRIGKLLLEK